MHLVQRAHPTDRRLLDMHCLWKYLSMLNRNPPSPETNMIGLLIQAHRDQLSLWGLSFTGHSALPENEGTKDLPCRVCRSINYLQYLLAEVSNGR